MRCCIDGGRLAVIYDSRRRRPVYTPCSRIVCFFITSNSLCVCVCVCVCVFYIYVYILTAHLTALWRKRAAETKEWLDIRIYILRCASAPPPTYTIVFFCRTVMWTLFNKTLADVHRHRHRHSTDTDRHRHSHRHSHRHRHRHRLTQKEDTHTLTTHQRTNQH
jgi:hypothetical protein